MLTSDERSRAHMAAVNALLRACDEPARSRVAARVVDCLAEWPGGSLP